ncbi:MAG: hypothetical protein R3300_12815 [Candidatus Promineifilaceae bacterium]|nr:hypothetical protein [Candidatus Promineifilaceae bacterium]
MKIGGATRPGLQSRFLLIAFLLAMVPAFMWQGILGAFLVLPVLATVNVVDRAVQARLLQLDPWPEPSGATSTEDVSPGSAPESSSTANETTSEGDLQSA